MPEPRCLERKIVHLLIGSLSHGKLEMTLDLDRRSYPAPQVRYILFEQINSIEGIKANK